MAFDYGEEFLDKYRKKEEDSRARRAGLSDFRIRPGDTAKIIMLDDIIMHLTRHNIKKVEGDRRWQETKTCLGDNSHCPYCEANNKDISITYAVCVGTIINTTGFTNNKGERIKNYKQNLVLKGEARDEYLHQRAKLRKKLGTAEGEKATVFSMWEVRRGEDTKSLATGSHFDYLGHFSKERLVEQLINQGVVKDDWDVFLTPDDYETTFAAETEEEARLYLGMSAKSNRIGSTVTTPPREEIADIPFDMDINTDLIESEPEL